MNDVDGGLGHFGQRDGAVGRLGLGKRRPGQRMVLGPAFALRQRLLDQDVDDAAILGMHHHHRPRFTGLEQRPENRFVVDHDGALVGHEQLEAGHALADQMVDPGELVAADVAHDHVKSDVDYRWVLFELAHPDFEGFAQLLPPLLHGEVDDCRRTAGGGGRGARRKGVDRHRPAKGHLHVGVWIDATGQEVVARRIDDSVGRDLQGPADQRDRAVFDEDVRHKIVGGGDDASAP